MVSRHEYLEFGAAIADQLIEMASSTLSRWSQLIERFSEIPAQQQADMLRRLVELSKQGDLGDATRLDVWQGLDKVIRHHRSFSTASWALQASTLDEMSGVADRFAPRDPVASKKWLFDSHMPELDSMGDDVAARLDEVGAQRREAVQDILTSGGIEAVVTLAVESKYPWFVGVALADVWNSGDEALLELADAPEPARAEFAFAFFVRRASTRGWKWVEDSLGSVSGRPLAQARLLRSTDDLERAWPRAEELGAEVDTEYWREFVASGRGRDFPLINETAARLISHDRPGTAVDALAMYVDQDKPIVAPDIIVSAFDALIGRRSDDPEFQYVQSYDVERLLAYLRASSLDEDRLATLEWRLLPALGVAAHSPVLERRLSRDPRFFVEILSLVFKPQHREEETDVSSNIAENAYRLLSEWKLVPGSIDRSGDVNEQELREWVQEARTLLEEADRAEIGDVYVGQVFAHAQEDPDGTWPTAPVRNLIESVASPDLESGFRTQIYNNRGITTRGLTDGGKQEYDLANQFEDWARDLTDKWPRTASVLRSVAEGYRADGRRYDEDSERFLRGDT